MRVEIGDKKNSFRLRFEGNEMIPNSNVREGEDRACPSKMEPSLASIFLFFEVKASLDQTSLATKNLVLHKQEHVFEIYKKCTKYMFSWRANYIYCSVSLTFQKYIKSLRPNSPFLIIFGSINILFLPSFFCYSMHMGNRKEMIFFFEKMDKSLQLK